MALESPAVVVAVGATAGSAAVSGVLGVELQVIAWSLVGGFFGAARAPPRSREARWLQYGESALQYVLASLLSALTATVVSRYLRGDSLLASLMGACFSFAFYPLTQRLVARAADTFDAALTKFGVPPPDKGAS